LEGRDSGIRGLTSEGRGVEGKCKREMREGNGEGRGGKGEGKDGRNLTYQQNIHSCAACGGH